MKRKIRLQDHYIVSSGFDPWMCPTHVCYRPCSTCAHWVGISTGDYRICKCPASDQFNKFTYRTYLKCEQHEI